MPFVQEIKFNIMLDLKFKNAFWDFCGHASLFLVVTSALLIHTGKNECYMKFLVWTSMPNRNIFLIDWV